MPHPPVLIIEDERHVARLIVHFLSKAGYSAVSAENAEKGLEIVGANRPDAIILDLVLPGMSGLEFLAAMRKKEDLQQVKVIVLTAHWFASDDRTLEDAGANAHCSKPVSPNNLIRILTDLGVAPSTSVAPV